MKNEKTRNNKNVNDNGEDFFGLAHDFINVCQNIFQFVSTVKKFIKKDDK